MNHHPKANLREMRPEDWPVVAAIYQHGMDTNLATFETVCPSWEAWDASHVPGGRLVAEEEGTIAGWTALSPVSSRRVYRGVAEVSIYIAPTEWGKGIATLLLAELVRVSERLGFWTLQSNIMEENRASLRLHAKCGFREVGVREKIGRDRFGVWRSNILMERRSCAVGRETG